jgi:pyruvate/2-oxoacid:ferredoxin oxidoreductase alpha subunit
MYERISEQLIFPIVVGLVLLLVPVLVVYTVRSWKKVHKKTKVIVLRYLQPVPKRKIKLTFTRLNGAKKIIDPWMPIILE